jgi:hypothetical protein
VINDDRELHKILGRRGASAIVAALATSPDESSDWW